MARRSKNWWSREVRFIGGPAGSMDGQTKYLADVRLGFRDLADWLGTDPTKYSYHKYEYDEASQCMVYKGSVPCTKDERDLVMVR